jgi:uncharacterized protein YwqG
MDKNINFEVLENLITSNPALAPYKDYLLKTAKPSVEITITKQGPNKLESKFGGNPLVAPGFEWPVHATGEYRFLGHINFSEIVNRPETLPELGLLSLFYAQDEDGELYWGDDGYILGYYWPDLECLSVVKPPYKDGAKAKRIELRGGFDLPRHAELRDDWPFTDDVLDDNMEQLKLASDYMLGYPSFYSLAYDPNPGKDWCTLLTLDSHDQFDWCWHDGDKLMVFIEAKKLAARDFSYLKADAG